MNDDSKPDFRFLSYFEALTPLNHGLVACRFET